LASLPAQAQSDAPVGVRAAGMGGAFTAVADDASAVFWNPAGLASGSYFSLVADYNTLETSEDAPARRDRSGLTLAMGTPPFGLSYYQTSVVTQNTPRHGSESNIPVPGHLERLVAHNVGVTLVQSITRSIAVASTVKWVHGVASSTPAGSSVPFDSADELTSEGSDKFDADFGVMMAASGLKAGLSVRNAFEPSFDAAGGGPPIELDRRIRAGVSMTLAPSLILAADYDFTKTRTSGGRWRDAAFGVESHWTRRLWGRAGFHWNTAGDGAPSAPIGSAGASFVVYGSIIADGQVSFGSSDGDRGWGVAARIVF
jgi:hypothetical protein